MTPHGRLPERPDISQLKRQAKDLLRSAKTGDPSALARFRTLPALARTTDEDLARLPLALHDAQSVIAREHGFASWRRLRDRAEELTLRFDAAVDRFVEAATDGQPDRAERLLAMDPQVAGASFHTALLLGDADSVEHRLADDATLAHRSGGPRGWTPLLYLCHDSLGRSSVADPDGLVAIARTLLDLGADPNTRFPWLHHEVRRPVLWGATFVTRLLPLARVLLQAGADPDDGVTFPLAVGSGHLAALELLREHGADVNQPWATDGAATLYSVLDWADTSTGIRWLLENGADPEPVFPPNGETPLHVVARRWDAAMAELVVGRGADPSRPRADGRTPYAVAQLNGNRAVAEWLLRHDASAELPEVDRLVAACSRGDRAAAEEMLAAHPELRGRVGPEHYTALYQAAERGDTAALEALLACGFDPDRGDDEMGKTALHTAAQAGRPDVVRVLLDHGASVAVRDREFHAQPLVWAADGSRSEPGDDRDHAEVARLLMEAGSPLEWEPGEGPAQPVLDILAEWRSARLAQRPES